MKTRFPDYFKKFKCIASECEDTCCAGWEIVIDDETYSYYNSVKGKFGERLKNEIILDEDEENIFVLKGNRCAFLNKDNMCDIYRELGGEYLCYTCKEYPRFTEEFGSMREVGLSLSCPEAARIILENPKMTEFEITEDDDMVSAYNDISYDIFIQLLTSRKLIMNIIQDRSIDLNHRISIILSFSQEIQKKIDENKINEIEHVRKKYSDENFIKVYINELNKFKNQNEIKYDIINKYFNIYLDIDHINDLFPYALNEAIVQFYGEDSNREFYVEKHEKFNVYYTGKEYEYEHLIVYFIFRYFMKGVYDYDILAKVKLAIVSMFIIKELDIVRWIKNGNKFDFNDQVDLVKMYSKDIEHSEENLELLYEIFETNEVFNLKNLLTVINNLF